MKGPDEIDERRSAQSNMEDKETAFYIAATGPASRPRCALKHNDAFVVIDSHGDIGSSAGGSDGFFCRDTRYLSKLSMTINGAEPLLLGSDIRDDNLNLYVDLTNPDLMDGDRISLEKDTAYIARTIFVRDGTLRERLAIVNHGHQRIDLVLAFSFDSDFADVFEVRGARRKQRGTVSRTVDADDTVLLSYEGRDAVRRCTQLSFEPSPIELHVESATFRVGLEPGQSSVICLRVATNPAERPRFSFTSDLSGARREFKAVIQDIATVETSNTIVNEILQRSLCDLYMLTTATPQGPYPYAGIPWYSTTFGRDGLIAAMQMLWFDPRIARGVLSRLASLQASSLDPEADAEPGKIMHEMREGEMANCREIPFGLYYGSVDSTPLFVILAGQYALRTGDYASISRFWPAIERALEWIDRWGDADGDGFVEYGGDARGGRGLANQGWKDSFDSVFHDDGRLAEGPIALAEVQGYVYLARKLAAHCAERIGKSDRAESLRLAAADLARKFEAAFWCEDLQFYALALDGAKRACKVRTSNAGHALFTGIMRSDRARVVALDLLRPHFLSGWGIRTVAQGEARYNPMSYHNGSVWPHDNAMIAAGFARYGWKRDAEPIFRGVMDAARYMPNRRLPELFCGFRRRPSRGPTLYPVACAPQAWAAGAPFQFLQATLGLRFDSHRQSIVLASPFLPSFINELVVRNLRLGDARADFRVLRHAGDDQVSLQILRIEGDLEISLSFDSVHLGAS